MLLLAIDLDTRQIRTWDGQVITALAVKRRDHFQVKVRFTRSGIFQQLATGATGILGVKLLSDYSGEYKAAALSWVQFGRGANAIYVFDLDLNTNEIAALFSANAASVALTLEIEWESAGFRESSLALPIACANDYVTGEESNPIAAFVAKASQAEAEAGVSNEKWMTPLRVFQAIAAWVAVRLGQPNWFASLGSDGKVPTSQLPTLALTSTQIVANAAARLALSSSAAAGQIIVEADTGKSYGLVSGGNPATAGDWVQVGDRDIAIGDVANLQAALDGIKGANITSASTTNLAAATGDFVDVTGNTTITALGTMAAGARRTVRFTGSPIITHNATSLILPTGGNITAAAGDVATFRSLGSGNWVCSAYLRATGKCVALGKVINNKQVKVLDSSVAWTEMIAGGEWVWLGDNGNLNIALESTTGTIRVHNAGTGYLSIADTTGVWANILIFPGETVAFTYASLVFTQISRVAIAASRIPNTPAGNIASTNLQAVVNELDSEKQPVNSALTGISGLSFTLIGIPENVEIPAKRIAGGWEKVTINDVARPFLANVSTLADMRTELGLGSVDNTSDLNKPVSNAQRSFVLETARSFRDIFNLATKAIGESLTGLSAGTTSQNLFSTLNHGTSTYVRSTTCFPAVAGIDMTAVSVWASDGTDKTVTLVTPDLAIGSHTSYPANGATVRFVTNTNSVVTATVSSSLRIGSSDVRVIKFTANLPATITPARYISSRNQHALQGAAVAYTDKNQKAYVGFFNELDNGYFGVTPFAAYSTFYKSGGAVSGDEGHPAFAFVDQKFIFLGATETLGVSQITCPGMAEFAASINTAAGALGSSNTLTEYKITTSVAAQANATAFAVTILELPNKDAIIWGKAAGIYDPTSDLPVIQVSDTEMTIGNLTLIQFNDQQSLNSFLNSLGAFVSQITPSSGNTITFGSGQRDETIYMTPGATLATLSIELPALFDSRDGQIERFFSTQAITSLTVSVAGSGVIKGTTLSTLSANNGAAYQRVSDASNGTWVRIS